jgi:hypothetical protein
LLGQQGEGSCLLPDFGIGGRADWLAAFGAEQSSIGSDTELLDVRQQDLHQDWGYRQRSITGG